MGKRNTRDTLLAREARRIAALPECTRGLVSNLPDLIGFVQSHMLTCDPSQFTSLILTSEHDLYGELAKLHYQSVNNYGLVVRLASLAVALRIQDDILRPVHGENHLENYLFLGTIPRDTDCLPYRLSRHETVAQEHAVDLWGHPESGAVMVVYLGGDPQEVLYLLGLKGQHIVSETHLLEARGRLAGYLAEQTAASNVTPIREPHVHDADPHDHGHGPAVGPWGGPDIRSAKS